MRPDKHVFRHSPSETIFVGFAGRIGAGKTSAAKYLSSQYAFQYARYSEILQEWLSCSGPVDRDRLRDFGWDVMAGGRQLELNGRLIGALDHSRSAVIDGLRHPVDFDSLSKAFGASFHLIFLEAQEEVRFERLHTRFSGREAFHAAESAPVEAHVDGMKLLARTTIPNEGPLESLYRNLDAWIAACEMGNQQ